MPNAGLTVFLVFFGISLLDALRGGDWPRVMFWFVLGLAFWAMDRAGRGHAARGPS